MRKNNAEDDHVVLLGIKLFEMHWVKAVGDNEKPAVFVVRN